MIETSKRLRGLIFGYLAIFVLCVSHMDMPYISVFHGNPPSAFLFLFFCFINVDIIIKRINWKLEEVTFGLLFLCSAVITIVINITNGYNNLGFVSSMKGYLVFFAEYVALRLIFSSVGKEKCIKLFKVLFWGYVVCTCFIGILEAVYIYFFSSPVLYRIIDFFVYRRLTSYLVHGRVQLWSEPSFASGYLLLIYIPAAYAMYKNSLISKGKLKAISFVVAIINLLTLSGRFIIDLIVFALIFLVVYGTMSKKASVKAALTLLIVVIMIMVVIVIAFSEQIAVLLINSGLPLAARFGEIFKSGFFNSTDYSLAVRIEYMRCALMAFLASPLFGYGIGNYLVALSEFYNRFNLDNWSARQEIMIKLTYSYDTSYCFYTTMLCHSGIFGLGCVICVLKSLIKAASRTKSSCIKATVLMVIPLLLQNEITSTVVALWLAIVNSGFESAFVGIEERNPNEKNINSNNNV